MSTSDLDLARAFDRTTDRFLRAIATNGFIHRQQNIRMAPLGIAFSVSTNAKKDAANFVTITRFAGHPKHLANPIDAANESQQVSVTTTTGMTVHCASRYRISPSAHLPISPKHTGRSATT
jgi:hypothetical protein